MHGEQLSATKNEQTARRDFLQALTASAAGTLLMGEPRRLLAAGDEGTAAAPAARADACILLWMGGGMAAPDTWDPKRYRSFEVGLPVEEILSTFPAIDTVVDNIKLSSGLEHIA